MQRQAWKQKWPEDHQKSVLFIGKVIYEILFYTITLAHYGKTPFLKVFTSLKYFCCKQKEKSYPIVFQYSN